MRAGTPGLGVKLFVLVVFRVLVLRLVIPLPPFDLVFTLSFCCLCLRLLLVFFPTNNSGLTCMFVRMMKPALFGSVWDALEVRFREDQQPLVRQMTKLRDSGEARTRGSLFGGTPRPTAGAAAYLVCLASTLNFSAPSKNPSVPIALPFVAPPSLFFHATIKFTLLVALASRASCGCLRSATPTP